MPRHKVIKLVNLTPLHIGTGKENYDFSATELQSDTISAALASLRTQNGKTDDLDVFLNSFVITSAFPFWGQRFFLPKMHGKIDIEIEGEEEHNIRKALKKIKFIEQEIWRELIAGNRVSINNQQLEGEFIVQDTDFGQVYKTFVNQRVSVPRGAIGDAEPFFFEWKYFHQDSGLYFIVDCEETVFNEIVTLFKQLGEIGLGTDKNIGGGKFEVDTSEISLPDVSDANHIMLLSLFIPTEDELQKLNLTQSKFDIRLRGGFMAGSSKINLRHLRKKSVYMFNVGSVFRTNEKLSGKIVDLKPDWNTDKIHSVFRSGKPFSLPVKIADYE